MRKIILFAVVVILSTTGELGASPKLAFERDHAIWIANLNGTGEKKIADGIFPAISPDGTRVAFVAVEKSGASSMRRVAVVEIAGRKAAIIFKDVPSDNSYYPAWSPDGKRIAFTLRENDVWDLATIAPDGTEFRFLKKGVQNQATLYSPCWARDEHSIFCQDLTNIYQISLDGTVLAQWKIEKIIPNGGISGDGRIAISPDGKRLLLSIDMGEEHQRRNWDGPPPALWIFEVAMQKAVRITRKTLFGWDGCWIDNHNILFLTQPPGEKSASLYRMSIKGKNLKRLIKNARCPTVSTP
jgi:TolB protein